MPPASNALANRGAGCQGEDFHGSRPLSGAPVNRRRGNITMMALTLALLLPLTPIDALSDTWSTPIPVFSNAQYEDGYPDLVSTGDGTLWIAWMGRDSLELDEEAYFSRWTGHGWQHAETINPPNQTDDRFPRLSYTRDGTLWALWQAADPNAQGVYLGLVARLDSAGWGPPDTVWTNGARYDSADILALSRTEAWVARDGLGPGGNSAIFAYHVAGQAEPEPHLIEDAQFPLYQPTLAADDDGGLWVAWYIVPTFSPTSSRIQYTRCRNGIWDSPKEIHEPHGLVRSRITFDQDGTKWIVCSAADPTTGPFGRAIWSLRWEGADWGSPVRISAPVAAADTTQTQLSLKHPGQGYPRAVWLLGDVDTPGRLDIVSAAWTGVAWGQPQRAGELRDTTAAGWPSVASVASGLTNAEWAGYMKFVPELGVTKVFTTYTLETPTSASLTEFAVAVRGSSVTVIWMADTDVIAVRVHREEESVRCSNEARPCSTVVLGDFEPPDAARGQVTDNGRPPGPCKYWLEVVSRTGVTRWLGPKEVIVGSGQTQELRIVPNPAPGVVRLRGRIDGRRGVITIFDVKGRMLRRMKVQPSTSYGDFETTWDGRTDVGSNASSGVYYASLAEEGKAARTPAIRVVLLR